MKIALVTGASRGIGKSIALKLAKTRNFFIIGTSTTREKVEELNDMFQSNSLLGQGKFLDLGKTNLSKFFNEIHAENKKISVLINNAGISDDNLFIKISERQLKHTIEINLLETFKLTQLAVKDMMKQKWGRVISISSVAARMGNKGLTHYSASKAAVEGFSRSLAIEVAKLNITVNAVSPGFIKTDMTKNLPQSLVDEMCKSVPINRLGEVDDIASIVNFLASEESSYITGETINVNGGLYMG